MDSGRMFRLWMGRWLLVSTLKSSFRSKRSILIICSFIRVLASLALDIADLLQIWTSTYLPSVFHRVVAPSPSSHSSESRYSMTYFSYGDNDCPIQPIPSPKLPQSWVDVYKLHGLDVVLSENRTWVDSRSLSERIGC
jgi:hypothetical protein